MASVPVQGLPHVALRRKQIRAAVRSHHEQHYQEDAERNHGAPFANGLQNQDPYPQKFQIE